MEKIELGNIYVSEIDTLTGHHVRFWLGMAGNSVAELMPEVKKENKITWKVTPSSYLSYQDNPVTFKAHFSKAFGLYIGENDKKSIVPTKIVPYDSNKEYFNIFDAERLK